ncbi:MAG TPA: hypothetical protein VGJ20_27525 [Xanthobacteraceae bacterium]|jgi:hypothetical protein
MNTRPDTDEQPERETVTSRVSLTAEPAGAPAATAEAAANPVANAAKGDAPAEKARSSRVALLAVTVALAAAVGSLLGALAAPAVMRLLPRIDGGDAAPAMKLETAELPALNTHLDAVSSNANAQFAAMAERLDRLAQAQSSPDATLAHIADTLDRLDKRRTAAAESTGLIAARQSHRLAPKAADRILDDWVVQDVRDGRALIASRDGGIFEVGSGSLLPGLGRVDAIKRQDGQWIVVTAGGAIRSER